EVLAQATRRARRRPAPHHPKTASALASTVLSRSPYATPRTSASRPAVATTLAGWLGTPRTFCGARNGESVSTRTRSAGTAAAASRSTSDFGYVILPANEQYQPSSATRSAHA